MKEYHKVTVSIATYSATPGKDCPNASIMTLFQDGRVSTEMLLQKSYSSAQDLRKCNSSALLEESFLSESGTVLLCSGSGQNCYLWALL